jgi:hypothetical protein
MVTLRGVVGAPRHSRWDGVGNRATMHAPSPNPWPEQQTHLGVGFCQCEWNGWIWLLHGPDDGRHQRRAKPAHVLTRSQATEDEGANDCHQPKQEFPGVRPSVDKIVDRIHGLTTTGSSQAAGP